MSSQFLNNFYTYQNAMRRIGLEDNSGGFVEEKRDAGQDIADVVRTVSHAERNLHEVRSVSNSYNEILKMIM
uniref:Uncharacterized protein n=1 Tax=uncultured Alphaproteobacteria bacterium TaxID=91750 RepID=A0A6G8F386_9PROT|nr:hypothetical protein PlAlph_6190 [uncultured Alphaproteobacteria bacterium]